MASVDSLPGLGDTIADASGRTHILSERLGGPTSGFGVIFRTTEPRTLVKFFKRVGVDVRGLIRHQRALPISAQNVVAPVAELLPPYNGYVMRAAFGGATWFDFNQSCDAHPGATWAQALTRVVEVLARLHQQSLVFGDLNPRNFLITPDGSDAVLVDLDTMVREGVPFEGRRYLAGRVRPAFLPPEFNERQAWAREDVWTLAKVVLLGWSSDGPALASLLPNAASLLYGDGARGVGDPLNPTALPTAFNLWRSLAVDHDSLLTCWLCDSPTQSDTCPVCDAQLAHAELTVHGIHGKAILRLNAASGSVLRRRHVHGGPHREADRICGSIEVSRHGLRISTSDSEASVGFDQTVRLETQGATLHLTARKVDGV